jgi:nicotinamidase/pyrazinamidase
LVKRLSKTYNLSNHDALLITDIQIDFLPGGALPVEGGDEIIPVINNYVKRFEGKAHVLASRDWHPPNHISFKAHGGPWPAHCVRGTSGAEFSPNLKLPKHTVIISKATDPKHEAYSAFDSTTLDYELRQIGVNRLFVAGLATDYCVVNTVLDACKLGFEAVVLMDATLGIDAEPGDVDRAIEKMVKNGAVQATEADFPGLEDTLPIEEAGADRLAEKPSMIDEAKKKAKMRSKSVNKRIKTEHRG